METKVLGREENASKGVIKLWWGTYPQLHVMHKYPSTVWKSSLENQCKYNIGVAVWKITYVISETENYESRKPIHYLAMCHIQNPTDKTTYTTHMSNKIGKLNE